MPEDHSPCPSPSFRRPPQAPSCTAPHLCISTISLPSPRRRSGDEPDPGGGGDDPPLSDADFIFYTCTAAFLVLMAGLMSGLTLGLMSLDQVDLEVLKRSGTSAQRACAAKILPVVAKPHRLLVTLLICNAAAAEALPLVLDRLTDPISAVLLSVTVVLIFGEIIPQAACSAYGLEIGAHSALFVRMLMFLTAPLAAPIAWVLDRVLGHRHTALFRRGELKALVDIHGEGQAFGGQLTSDEVRIIKGALDLTHKRARAAMTPLDMAFMLPMDATLDEVTLTGILASGHSRIPVHRPGNRSDVVGILLTKELILVDIHAGVKVSAMKVRSLPHLLAETPMYDMLKLFELGRSHMAVLTQPTREALARLRAEAHEVAIDLYSISDGDFGSSDEDVEREGQAQRRVGGSSSASDVDSAGPGLDLFSIKFEPHELQRVGLITIEDVLEELLGAEIVDETDNYVDNLGRTRVNAADMARSLPPHLRKVLGGWGLTPRVGPALQVYRMASGGGGDDGGSMGVGGSRRSSVAAPAEGSDGGGTTFAAHLPRVGDQRRRAGVGTNPVGFLSARRPSGGGPVGRRSTNMTQAVQDQLDLLQPLIDARHRRFTVAKLAEEGDGDEIEPVIGSLRRENSI